MLTYSNTQTNVHDLQVQTTDGKFFKKCHTRVEIHWWPKWLTWWSHPEALASAELVLMLGHSGRDTSADCLPTTAPTTTYSQILAPIITSTQHPIHVLTAHLPPQPTLKSLHPSSYPPTHQTKFIFLVFYYIQHSCAYVNWTDPNLTLSVGWFQPGYKQALTSVYLSQDTTSHMKYKQNKKLSSCSIWQETYQKWQQFNHKQTTQVG